MTMRALVLAVAVLVAGCDQGADSGRAPGHDGAVDLGPFAQPDGPGSPEVGAPDGGQDRDSTIDRGNRPDGTAEPGTNPDLAVDLPIGADLVADINTPADRAADLAADRDASADLASADTARGATDLAVEVPTADGSADSGCALVDDITVDKLPPISVTYHDQPQIENYLQAVASALPAIATYKVLGQSGQGRDLVYLIINATCQASPPAIFANGTHHGDEPSSTEAALAIPDYLLRRSTTDATVRSLLQTYAFYVMPLVNPDGFALHTRENAAGLDINRDYSYPGRSDADSFKTLEAGLVKSLQESVGFRAAITYHSGAQEVLWPWCYTGDATADDSFFTAAGQRTAQAMNFAIYQQSYDDYPTQGEYIDYAYWKSHTLASTFEVSTAKTPSAASLASVVDSACKGTVAWVQAVNDRDKGSLHALPATAAARRRFPLTAPFDGTNRLE
jgi:Predicted carboxypeptidase